MKILFYSIEWKDRISECLLVYTTKLGKKKSETDSA